MLKQFIIHRAESNRVLPQLENLIVVEPIFNENPAVSLRLTVLDILEKHKGEDVIIYEDDVKFTEYFDIQKLQQIADKYRGQIDYINTGVLLREPSIVNPFNNEPNLRHCNYFQGTQCVYYLPTALEKLKASYQTYIDRMLHLKTYGLITYPFMTIQKEYNDKTNYKDKNVEELFEISESDKRWKII